MLGRKLHFLPIFMAVYLPINFLISYGMAVSFNHVLPDFPYISDTGTLAPESCVFGQLLNIYALLAGICVFIRFRQIDLTSNAQLEISECSSVTFRWRVITNRISLVVGFLAALGCSLVANFQETSLIQVHLLGALMAFGLGGVYMWIQWAVTLRLRDSICVTTSRVVLHCRLILCIIQAIFFVVMLVGTSISIRKFDGTDKKHWLPSNKGYAEHIVATAAEWGIALCTSCYFATFYKDFGGYKIACVMDKLESEAVLSNHTNGIGASTSSVVNNSYTMSTQPV